MFFFNIELSDIFELTHLSNSVLNTYFLTSVNFKGKQNAIKKNNNKYTRIQCTLKRGIKLWS